MSLIHQGSDRTIDPNTPMTTVTCAVRGELALSMASMVATGAGYSTAGTAAGAPPVQLAAHVNNFNKGSTGHACDEPLATVTSGGNRARPAGGPTAWDW